MKPIDRITHRLATFRTLWRRKNFLADRRGTTAIEFAMISVPFLGLIGGIFETGLVYFRSAQLQTATETASRAILTNNLSTGLTYQQFIDQFLCTWKSGNAVKPGTLSTMFDCDKLIVDIRPLANWDASSTGRIFNAAPRAQAINIPAPGQIAIVRIMYPQRVVMGLMAGSPLSTTGIQQIRSGQEVYEGAWTHMLMGVAAFRVEPGN